MRRVIATYRMKKAIAFFVVIPICKLVSVDGTEYYEYYDNDKFKYSRPAGYKYGIKHQ